MGDSTIAEATLSPNMPPKSVAREVVVALSACRVRVLTGCAAAGASEKLRPCRAPPAGAAAWNPVTLAFFHASTAITTAHGVLLRSDAMPTLVGVVASATSSAHRSCNEGPVNHIWATWRTCQDQKCNDFYFSFRLRPDDDPPEGFSGETLDFKSCNLWLLNCCGYEKSLPCELCPESRLCYQPSTYKFTGSGNSIPVKAAAYLGVV